jgi:ABC-type nitrate/sulfonate/bicarbonate transport system substrate-binding protein
MNSIMSNGGRGIVARCARIAKLAGFPIAMALVLAAPANAQDLITDEELVLRMGDVSANKFPFILAYDEGLYLKNGIKVTPKFSPGSVAVINKSGIEVAPENIYDPESKVPHRIAVSGSGPTIVGIATRAGRAPGPLILGSTHTHSRWRIITGPNITSPEQLKGKRLGYSGFGAVSHNQWLQFCEYMGWDPQFDVSLMSGALGVDALTNGEVDAVMGPELHATMAIMNDFHTPIDLADYDFPVSGSSMMVDREWYKNNREAARAFVKTAVEAIAIMKQDKAKAERTMKKWYGMTDPVARDLFYTELLKIEEKPYPPYDGIKMIMRLYDSHEMRKYTPEFFYDDSIIKELDESGYIDSLYKDR